jgi:hypothetical protein
VGNGDVTHLSLNSALCGDEWSASRLGHFTPSPVSPRKVLVVPMKKRLCGLQTCSGCCGERKIKKIKQKLIKRQTSCYHTSFPPVRAQTKDFSNTHVVGYPTTELIARVSNFMRKDNFQNVNSLKSCYLHAQTELVWLSVRLGLHGTSCTRLAS